MAGIFDSLVNITEVTEQTAEEIKAPEETTLQPEQIEQPREKASVDADNFYSSSFYDMVKH